MAGDHRKSGGGDKGILDGRLGSGVRCESYRLGTVMVRRMTGVAIRGSQVHRGSTFSTIFAPVLPQIRHLWWVVDEHAFHLPDDLPDSEVAAFSARMQWVAAEGDDPRGYCVDTNYICDKGFVPDYAAWVNHDWYCLHGFVQPLTDWRGWLRAGHKTGSNWKAERAEYLENTTEVYFFGLDTNYWEFFAHDASLVQLISEAAQADGLVAKPALLAESVGL